MNLKSSSFGFLIIAICFVFSGSCNTIVAKWIDKLKGVNRDGLDVSFNHPFVQSWFMFVGEFLCLIAFNVQLCWMRYNGHEIIPGVHESLPMNRFSFAIPALCDTCGTTLLYIGMTMTHASVAQMLRGSSMIFTALISYLFLDQRLRMYHLVGIGFTLSGLCLVGISSMLLESKSLDATNPIAGNICIICAQLVVGIQMVAEEKILSKHSVPPLQTVGWEGVWGITIISSILGLFQALPYVHHEWKIPDDFIDGAIQIYNGKVLKIAVSGAILSIAFFNYFGLSITKRASATTRTVLDSIRTLFIWIFGLLVHWQNFQWLQPVGFVLMLLGTAIYRGFIRIPRLSYEEVEDLAKDFEENAVLIQSIA